MNTPATGARRIGVEPKSATAARLRSIHAELMNTPIVRVRSIVGR
jgi:hypothetical protein